MEVPKTTSEQCDRPCTDSPRNCVFDFKLEMLTSDNDGMRADGRVRSVLAYNRQIPGPPIVICEGDTLVVKLTNNINGNMTNMDGSSDVTTLHFHGIREKTRPWSDGVPFVSQCPITPEGQSHPKNENPSPFPYGFNTDKDGAPPGTYWYHSHVGAQRTNGAYGALIIKEKGKDTYIDKILVLQEWYESSTNQVPVSILINGNGRTGEYINTGEDAEITKHLKGKGGSFQLKKNKYFDRNNFKTNYEECIINEPGKTYRFRVIGAISQNFPLRLSIDDHKFTAIAMDSRNIEPVPDLTDLWLAAGERYDIVVQTKAKYKSFLPYMIRVFGYTNQHNHAAGSLCTIAWLLYPGQTIDYKHVTDSACTGFHPSSPLRTLNPVPNNYKAWNNRIKYPHLKNSSKTGDIFITDLRAKIQEPTIKTNLADTQYIEFDGNITFNGLRMTYPRVPFLLQNPADETDRCTTKTPANYSCQNVLQEPWAKDHWAEIVLVNKNDGAASHPIHQHGGWYWVVGEDKYDNSITANRDFIMDKDQKCLGGCLPQNFINPPAKDTIQVPPNGYVILRTPLDNPGTWIFHCHINYHVTIGMAMVLQIGEPEDWCTKHLHQNVPCKTPPPPPGGGPTTIHWFLGMENAERCVNPGTEVTFNWVTDDHNVIKELTEAQYDSCNVTGYDHAHYVGNANWTAPMLNGHGPETFYFACGRFPNATGIGDHCYNGGMKAKIHVRSDCTISVCTA
eukprot:GFUD01082936.1.p1 GENE.GFUD01082936.1~~GFUD01082936.1.p1  ORF type:complete len:822 (-),score=120.73 GFUD01082936.1:1221-3419(-)